MKLRKKNVVNTNSKKERACQKAILTKEKQLQNAKDTGFSDAFMCIVTPPNSHM